MEDLIGRQFGAYRIVGALGEGGMAAVYKAYQPAMDRHVAIKVLPQHLATDATFISRFQHEAKILAQLQHPHILPVFDFGKSDHYFYLVMPLVQGGTLAHRLLGKPLPLSAVERIMRQICEGIGYAHTKGIVHRDIKPSNVLMDEVGNCLVSDFGIARLAEGATRLTMTGTIMGTPEYMSPEQAEGQELDRSSDIYSLGIVLYEMLAGRVPYKAETPVGVLVKHVNGPLPLPHGFNPDLPPGIEDIVVKALARVKADRFHTADELTHALTTQIRQLETRKTIVPVNVSTNAVTRPASVIDARQLRELPRGSRTLRWAGLAAAAVVLAAGGIFLFRTGQQPAQQTNSTTTSTQAVPAPTTATATVVPPSEATPTPTTSIPGPHVTPPTAATPPATTLTGTKTQSNREITATRASNVTVPEPVLSDWERASRGCAGGSAAECRSAALMLDNGSNGVAKDIAKAAEYFERSCNSGNAESCTDIAVRYESGRGASHDDAKAFALYKQGCDAGGARSCTGLGTFYAAGRIVPRDEAQAVALYQKSCDAGGTRGCALLALGYLNGRGGLSKDETKAADLFRRSCNGNDLLGCVNLADLYRTGRGVPQDFVRALSLYERACDAGNGGGGGCRGLGTLYANGQGVVQDQTKAVGLYERACEMGLAAACNDAGIMYNTGRGVMADPAKAYAHFQRACNGSVPAACANQGLMTENGRGVPADLTKAVALYQRSCDLGGFGGCGNLGRLYERGRGVPANEQTALGFYTRACTLGDGRGCADKTRLENALRSR